MTPHGFPAFDLALINRAASPLFFWSFSGAGDIVNSRRSFVTILNVAEQQSCQAAKGYTHCHYCYKYIHYILLLKNL